MNKEEILKMSREEHLGKQDEWERSVGDKAARMGRGVGLAVCLLLVLVCHFLKESALIPQTAWLVFFAMEGSSNLVRYRYTKKRSELVWGVLEMVGVAGYGVILAMRVWMDYGR